MGGGTGAWITFSRYDLRYPGGVAEIRCFFVIYLLKCTNFVTFKLQIVLLRSFCVLEVIQEYAGMSNSFPIIVVFLIKLFI